MAKFDLAATLEIPVDEVTQTFNEKFADPIMAATAEVNYYVVLLATNRPTRNEILGYGLAVERLTKLKHNIKD